MIGSKHIFIIGSCKASGAALTTINGVEAVSIFPEAAEALYEAGGGEAASLFALPERVVRPDAGIDTITWYTDVSGTPAPLASLPAAEQLTATARLEVILRRLAETRSPAVQGFLRAALNVLTPESLHVVSGQPVIINWGMVPEAAAADSDSHAAHVAATVGPYLPPSIRPELAVDEPAFATPQDGAGAAGVATAAVAGAAVLTGAATAAAAEGSAEGSDETSGDAQDADALPSDSYGTADADAVEPAGPGGETHRETTVVDGAPAHVAVERPSVWRDSAFATLIGLVVLLLLFVVYALWPGNLIYPQPARSARITDDDALAARRQINRSLREQITELQDLSDEDVCRLAPGVLETGLRVPPVGPTAPIQPTPGTGMPPAVAEATPPDGTALPDATQPAPRTEAAPGDGSHHLDNTELLERLEQATVFVVGSTPDGVSTGSGFFVTSRHVITNFHVIENVRDGKIVVSNGTLSSPKPVRIVNRSASSDIGSDDFALLELAEPATGIVPVALTPHSERLTPVVAAGYPSFIISSDQNFVASFRGGDMSRLRNISLAVTTGSITAEQQGANGIRLLAHSATISPGNSGGPLADLCGRIVGVNTFTRTDSQNALRLNFALGASDLLAFLQRSNIDVAVQPNACSARPAAVAAAPPTVPDTPPAAAAVPDASASPVTTAEPDAVPNATAPEAPSAPEAALPAPEADGLPDPAATDMQAPDDAAAAPNAAATPPGPQADSDAEPDEAPASPLPSTPLGPGLVAPDSVPPPPPFDPSAAGGTGQ